MCVPGAVMSGFLRWSEHGPREEKLMMSSALSAPVLATPQPSLPVMRQFSLAPTVMIRADNWLISGQATPPRGLDSMPRPLPREPLPARNPDERGRPDWIIPASPSGRFQ